MTAVSRIKITNRQSIIVSTVGSVMVRVWGLEPQRIAAREPKSRMSTNFIIPANRYSSVPHPQVMHKKNFCDLVSFFMHKLDI